MYKMYFKRGQKKINLHLRFTVTSNNTDVGCAYEKDREKRRKGTYTRSVEMENRIGAPRPNRPSIARENQLSSLLRILTSVSPSPFSAARSVLSRTGTFIPFRHRRRSCLIDRPETGASSRGETDSEIAGGAFEGLRNSIPPQSCSILFVNDRIKEEMRFSLLTGPLFIQNRHSYFTSVICKASHSLPPVGRLAVSVTFLSLLCDSISVRVYLAKRVKREIEGEGQGEGGGERSR